MIQFRDVSKVYRTDRIETLALDSIDVEVQKAEFVSVMGPSGCGKSTLLNLMGMLDAPSSGEISSAEVEATRASLTRFLMSRPESPGRYSTSLSI